jgi:ankyrin repeat protein
VEGHVDLVPLLLSYNADVSAKDILGETALHYAVRSGNEEVVRMLLQKVSVSTKTESPRQRYVVKDSVVGGAKRGRKRSRVA